MRMVPDSDGTEIYVGIRETSGLTPVSHKA